MQHNLQTLFKDSIYDELDKLVPYMEDFGDITKEERLEVYRNSAFVNLKETLLNVFPAISKMVDIKFFRYLTHEYIKSSPPSNGCLDYYGENFSAFIETFESLKGHPYLADLARLEWLFTQSYNAEDYDTVNLEAFAKINTDKYELLTFYLHPSVNLIKSSYPIYSLWEMTKNDACELQIDMSKSENVLIYRTNENLDVFVKVISFPELIFLNALKNGQNFKCALDVALVEDNEFNPQEILSLALNEGLFSAVNI